MICWLCLVKCVPAHSQFLTVIDYLQIISWLVLYPISLLVPATPEKADTFFILNPNSGCHIKNLYRSWTFLRRGKGDVSFRKTELWILAKRINENCLNPFPKTLKTCSKVLFMYSSGQSICFDYSCSRSSEREKLSLCIPGKNSGRKEILLHPIASLTGSREKQKATKTKCLKSPSDF